MNGVQGWQALAVCGLGPEQGGVYPILALWDERRWVSCVEIFGGPVGLSAAAVPIFPQHPIGCPRCPGASGYFVVDVRAAVGALLDAHRAHEGGGIQ